MNLWTVLVSTTLIAMMMSLAIRGSTCEEGGDDKYNHEDEGERKKRIRDRKYP